MRMTALCLLALTAGAAHAGQACVFEGRLNGQAIKDCTEIALDLPAEPFRQQCEQKQAQLATLGGDLRAYALPACPQPALASCRGALGNPSTVYHYTAAAAELAGKAERCQRYGGTWQSPP